MGRRIEEITENITIAYGNDHELGTFVDVMDRRYAESGFDEQGEGYIIEWCKAFQFSTNLVGITFEDLIDEDKLTKIVNNYYDKQGYNK